MKLILASKFNMQIYYYVIFLLLTLLNTTHANATTPLRILAWEGYTDEDLVREFEQEQQLNIKVTYIYSDEELWEKMTSPSIAEFDVIAVNTAELQRYINRELVRPINLEQIPNLQRQNVRFKERNQIAGLIKNNQTFAIPYTYSEMGLIYNRKLVHQPPESINALWDSRYASKVLIFNTSAHNFTLAALGMGLKNPFDQTTEQLRESARRLVELRRNILTVYSSPQEAVKLFKTQDIALIYANYGSQQLKALSDVGADVGYAIPEDGTLAWLDCWAIGKNAPPQAELWINFMLSEKVSQRLSNTQGLANTTQEISPDQQPHLIWLQPIEDSELRTQLWEQIISGDVMERF